MVFPQLFLRENHFPCLLYIVYRLLISPTIINTMFIETFILLFAKFALADDPKPGPFDFQSYPHGNPFIPGVNGYPDAAVHYGTYWVYHANFPGDPNNQYIRAYSSQDLKIWRTSSVLSRGDFAWATGPIYSPAIANRTGQYYLYFSTTAASAPNGLSIGVGVASKPDGPFIDIVKKPLLTTNDPSPDSAGPTVITDPRNGQTYLYYVECGSIKVVKLAADMINIAPSPPPTTLKISNSTANGTSKAVPPISGNLKIFRRNTKYYLAFKKKDCSTALHYAISDNLNGPFSYIGTFFQVDKALSTSFGHGTVINVLNTDIWYLVYSRELVMDDGWQEASLTGLAYERVFFTDNGTLPGIISPVKTSLRDDFQYPVHDGHIWREYTATYQQCLSPATPPQPDVWSRCSISPAGGDGDGRSMLHNNFADFILDIKVFIQDNADAKPKSDANAGVVFRVKTPLLTGDSPSTDFAGYFAGITLDKKVILGKVDGGKWVYLGGANLPGDFNTSALNLLRVKAVGPRIQVWVGDVTVSPGPAPIDVTDATYSAGQTGTKAYNCAAGFDDLVITSDVGGT
ncbi:Glycosyl hydrolase, five-bladed beta-propellor domain containing protein [Naviculisporaceae sp. PSN 640]